MSSLAKHVIHRPKPIRSALIVFFAITITALSFWLYHQNYNERAILKINDLSQKNKLLTTNKQALINENGQLLKQVQQQTTQIESHQHFVAIQKVTDEQLQLQLSKLQSEIVILNKDLMFYQNVTQGTGDSKLQIRELHLRQDNTLHPKVLPAALPPVNINSMPLISILPVISSSVPPGWCRSITPTPLLPNTLGLFA